MVNIIANRHKAGVPRLKHKDGYTLHYHAQNFRYQSWRTEMQATNIFPVDTLHFPNGQWYWARVVSKDDEDGTIHEGDLYLFDPGFKITDTDAGKAYGKWAEVYNYDGEIWCYIGSENVNEAIYGGDIVDSYETNGIDNGVAWVNKTMLDFVNANILASRHKAGIPTVEDDGWFDLHYNRDFQYHAWRADMLEITRFPVNTLRFPDGKWYWARIVSQVDENGTTAEGDLYVFDPGFKVGKWAEIHDYGYGEEVRAYIGSSEGTYTVGYNAYELDYYEADSLDDAVAWVNKTMPNLVNEH